MTDAPKLLFITATRLGDGVIATGALDYLLRQHPGVRVTVACGPLVQDIYAAAPGVERVIALKKEPYHGHWRKLARETLGTRWDVVADLRDSLLSRLLRAKVKHIGGRQDKSRHKVEQMSQIVGAPAPAAPVLWFDAAAKAEGARLVPEGGPVLGVGPAANWAAKTWPAERFIDLIERLTGPAGILPGARVAVFAAPGEEEVARRVLNSVPAGRGVDVIAKAKPLAAAAAIARCAFYVGNDSGLMHAAAAAGVPTLGLFGPSWPHLYRPWGPHTAFVSTPETFAQLTSYPGYAPETAPCLMNSLTVEAAESTARKLWASLPAHQQRAVS